MYEIVISKTHIDSRCSHLCDWRSGGHMLLHSQSPHFRPPRNPQNQHLDTATPLHHSSLTTRPHPPAWQPRHSSGNQQSQNIVIFLIKEVTVAVGDGRRRRGILLFAALEQSANQRLLFVLFLNERQGAKEAPTQSGKARL